MNPIRNTLMMALAGAVLAGCADVTLPEPEQPSSPSITADLGRKSTRQAVNLEFGELALHIPRNVRQVRGIILALGGPNTKGFALGTPFGAPPPVEQILQQFGADLRDLAARRGLAILGSSRFGPTLYPDQPASDQLLLDGIKQAASLTGRHDLRHAPILMFGISGGAPEATGFVQRNPGRVMGMFLKVPASVTPFTGQALRIPTLMVLAGNDVFVDNAALRASFEQMRTKGAPWAMAVEPGVPHHSLSESQQELVLSWINVVAQRGKFHPLWLLPSRLGFVGDHATGKIMPANRYKGDPKMSSWLPTRPLGRQWAVLAGW